MPTGELPAVLVTGGAGYIGSHTCKALAMNYLPVSYDNLCRGNPSAVKWGPLEQGDIRDETRLDEVLARWRPVAVVHFAAFAYVGESLATPADYYSNNVGGVASVLAAMQRAQVPNLVFSSSCATYGLHENMPIDEDADQRPINPYGHSKLMAEQVVRDWCLAHGSRAAVLRYFNAAGCDPEGHIGEDHDPEPHLIPRVLGAASGRMPALDILGTDYPTADGTCVRDYIHVTDLAAAHVRALNELTSGGQSFTLNLGTGRGHSVRQVVAMAERITGRPVAVREQPRRPGDPPILIADASRAAARGYHPSHSTLENMIGSAWAWECRNRGIGDGTS